MSGENVVGRRVSDGDRVVGRQLVIKQVQGGKGRDTSSVLWLTLYLISATVLPFLSSVLLLSYILSLLGIDLSVVFITVKKSEFSDESLQTGNLLHISPHV